MSRNLLVIVPSRGRPHTLPEMLTAFRATCTAADVQKMTTHLLYVVDEDDPTIEQYWDHVRGIERYPDGFDWKKFGIAGGPKTPVDASMLVNPNVGTMNSALNTAALAMSLPKESAPFAIAFMGDDHRPRSLNWDAIYLQQLYEMGTGIVYGNDLLQGVNLPTQVAMTTDIIRTLAHMAPPGLKHLYLDNYWRDLGMRADCLRYLPDVIVEHMHPVASKATWDDNYARVNGYDGHDKAVYDAYIANGVLDRDVNLVRALRQPQPGRQ